MASRENIPYRDHSFERGVIIQSGSAPLHGLIALPPSPRGFVLFAHGSGSSHLSPRNLQVARTLNQAGIGTLLFDLLTPAEGRDRTDIFNIPFLAERLNFAKHWVYRQYSSVSHLPIGFFGASTGAGAALWAAAEEPTNVSAIVSRGGRPDLAVAKLEQLNVPTLLIVGEKDPETMDLNLQAKTKLSQARLITIANASHIFEESGTLEEVAVHAKHWFLRYFEKGAKPFRESALYLE